ncbi:MULTISPECIES: hypothetical protein [Streptomyces]|uniref:hypothetical protein n=1 Tax=Streptomyces TaxID=1883 RepID=UPI00332703DF
MAHLRVENFRVFGPAAQGDDERDDALSLSFTAGTNVLVGENDSGKTAIRLCLQSAASDYYRVSQDDFHLGKDGRAETFTIGCAFTDLSTEEQAVFLELLTHDRDGTAWLCVTFKAQRMDPLRNTGSRSLPGPDRTAMAPPWTALLANSCAPPTCARFAMQRRNCARAASRSCPRSSPATRR